MTTILSTTCKFCGREIDPLAHSTFTRVEGWEHKALSSSSRRGGSDIVLREQFEQFAHAACIDRERNGVHVEQTSLLDVDASPL